MRFVLLTQYFVPEIGAPQTRLQALCRELVAAGHEVEVVTAMPNYPTGRIAEPYNGRLYVREQRDGIVIHRTWLIGAMGSGIRRMLGYLSFALTCVAGLLRCRRPTHVFVESPPLFLVLPAWILSTVWRAQLIMNVADMWPDAAVEMGLIRKGPMLSALSAFEHFSYRRANVVNAVTEGVRSRLAQDKGVPESKVLFFPNAADTRRFRPDARNRATWERLGLDDRPTLLYTGTLGFIHGLDPIVEAMAVLERESNPAVLCFIGDGSERARIQQLSIDLGLRNVRFVDPVPIDVIAEALPQCRAAVVAVRDIPVARGARPSKLFPAWASGRPVVYCGPGEGAELVRTCGGGLVAESADPVEVAAHIRRLVADPEFADTLGNNGLRFVQTELSWTKVVNDWLADLAARGDRRLRGSPSR